MVDHLLTLPSVRTRDPFFGHFIACSEAFCFERSKPGLIAGKHPFQNPLKDKVHCVSMSENDVVGFVHSSSLRAAFDKRTMTDPASANNRGRGGLDA